MNTKIATPWTRTLFAFGLGALTFTGGMSAALAGDRLDRPSSEAPKPAALTAAKPSQPAPVEAVDLVICLDTSGSMSGLLDAARQKIWDVVSLVGSSKQKVSLRVALISFGGNREANNGYVVLEAGLTDDLDTVYESLMKLRAAGGTEYVGGAIKTALDGLSWGEEAKTLRLLFVAGNESADQDMRPGHRVQEVVRAAVARKVTVNTIFCGNSKSPEAEGWRQVSTLGKGSFTAIDQNREQRIASPFDAELNGLSSKLNQTYLAYGPRGRASAARQARMDEDAAKVGVAAERAGAKASGLYTNSGWDLVDAVEREGFDWDKVAKKDLPLTLRGKTTAEKQVYVAKLKAERAVIQKRIRELSAKRIAFVKAERAKQAKGGKSLQDALTSSIKSKAEAAGLSFRK
ncbi:MAG: VWA domain-containing protein [Planctomycetes bacterium]|nr:VWA domain-containing protein [Planctomycetota bacterium]